MDEPHDKLILVLGVTSGGTSVVAGMLHHLGVNMGNIRTDEEWKEYAARIGSDRDYNPYECVDAYRVGLEWELSKGIPRPFIDMRRYIRNRLTFSDGKPCGVKCNRFTVLGEYPSLPDELPVRIVRITRPLEDVIASDTRYMAPNNLRSELLTRMFQRCTRIAEWIPPVWEMGFDDVLKDPSKAVWSLDEALKLNAPSERIEAAVSFFGHKLEVTDNESSENTVGQVCGDSDSAPAD